MAARLYELGVYVAGFFFPVMPQGQTRIRTQLSAALSWEKLDFALEAFATAGRGVNVNAIAPGYVRTDNTQALQDDSQRSATILERIPAGRWGTPDDFAGPVVFLASSASDYMNGSIVTVDGGWMGR